MPPTNNFASWLDHYLTTLSLDLSHVAARANISQPYLSMLRQGARINPSREVVEALANVLGAPLEEALQAAGKAIRSREAPALSNQLIPTARTAPMEASTGNWQVELEVGDVFVSAEAQPIGANQIYFRIQIAPRDKMVEPQGDEFVIQPGTQLTFSLRCGGQQLYCEVTEEQEELVLRLPLRGRGKATQRKDEPSDQDDATKKPTSTSRGRSAGPRSRKSP